MPTEHEVTRLLEAHRQGDRDATAQLVATVYEELHRLASRQLQRGRPGETLNTTGLVHEAYIRLFDAEGASWNDRAHLLAVSATAMRQIIVDHVRRRQASKRGGTQQRTELHADLAVADGMPVGMLDLDEALERLAEMEPRLARVVELRFFTGLTQEEIAEVLGVTRRTVDRDWFKAKAFLHMALKGMDN